MQNDKPYADFMFLGMKSFTDELKKAGTDYSIIKDKNADSLLNGEGAIFKSDTDTIKTGFASRGEKKFYFVEFGMQITPNILSYIVFLFNNPPTLDEMKLASRDIEPLVNEYLDGVGMPGPGAASAQDVEKNHGGQ